MENNDLFGSGGLDLGNDVGASFDGFMPIDDPEAEKIFGSSASIIPDNVVTTEAETPKAVSPEGVKSETEIPMQAEVKDEAVNKTDEAKTEKTEIPVQKQNESESTDIFTQAMQQAEAKQAESTKNSLIDKLPVFSYANAETEIVDTSITFDELREEKSEDFAEFDDADAIEWKMTYGTISKNVPYPKKSTIAEFKKKIESSKEFTEMLKKAKGEIKCKVIPSKKAKKKGVVAAYKGFARSVAEAKRSGKVISFVPSKDGNMYEVRANKIGTFIAQTDNVTIPETDKVTAIEEVRAGFIPALPKIPYTILSNIIAFFKTLITEKCELEALAYIYWSVDENKYHVYVPKQRVSKASVDSYVPEIDEEKFILVMEIHSHNTMPAVFSQIDDRDERATRLYAVVGRMDNVFPDIKVRCSVGRKFVEVNPNIVFEDISGTFPPDWLKSMEVKKYRRYNREISIR